MPAPPDFRRATRFFALTSGNCVAKTKYKCFEVMFSQGLKMRQLLGIAVMAIASCVAGALHAASDKVALVVGMAQYQSIGPLANTVNDAEGLARVLDDIGFDVTLATDIDGAEFRQQIDDFSFRAETADLALIYFAGHGVEIRGENFLIPIDANIRNSIDVQRQSISLQQMLDAVDSARKMRIVILDSCRNNPLSGDVDAAAAIQSAFAEAEARAAESGGGLAAVDPDRGTLVAYAARDGQVALDGNGLNSPFATALMEKIAQPGLEISLMFRQVRDQVLEETGNLQEPYTYGSLTGVPFYLAGPARGQVQGTQTDAIDAWAAIRPDQEEQMLAMADLGDTRSMLGLAFMRLNPNQGRFDPEAAVDFLTRAAEAGEPEAQYELAKLYERGVGVDIDPARALELYQMAADEDFAKAINDLGFLNYYGHLGLSPNPERALELFGRAADLRHPQAQFNYAALIDDGLIAGKGADDSAAYLYAALRSGSRDVLDLLQERPTMFTPPTRKALQRVLKENGFYQGAIDGAIGPGTRKSIRLALGLTE